MPTPLEAAAESLAPPAPTTRFFTGTPSVVSQLYTSRRGAESAAAVADEATRLGRSRWDRAAQRRQLIEWGREDQEHAARKDFESQRGEFLSQIALIDPNTDDYEQTKAELLGSLPRPAMEDDAVRAIFAAKDRVFQNRMMVDRQEAAADRRLEDARIKDLDAARKAFALEGGTPEAAAKVDNPYELYRLAGEYRRMNAQEKAEYNNDLILGRERERAGRRLEDARIKDLDAARKAFALEGGTPEAAAKVDNPYELYRLAGEYRRMNAQEKAEYNNDLILGRERERAGIRGTGNVQKGKERRAALETAVMDEGRFPETLMGETGAERLTELLNMAANADEKQWVNAAGDISDYGKQTRRAVWQEAQEMKKRLGGETPAAPAPEPAGVLDLPKPPKPGVPIDEDTALRYVEASGGNVMEAMQRAEAAEWAIPKKK